MLSVWTASPAYAIDPPDDIDIIAKYANRNLLETGDLLIYAHYNLVYASTPSEPVNETFIFRLMSVDGTSELGRTLAYPYADLGYGQGVVAWYFPAATAPTWGQPYIIRVSPNPQAFDDPPAAEQFVMSSGDYSGFTSTADNRAELASRIITIASDLETAWNATLLSAQDVSTTLSSVGEAYFRGAIPGLQNMAPSLFYVQVFDPDTSGLNRTYNLTQGETYTERFNNTLIGNATAPVSSLFHWNNQFMTSAIIVGLCVAAVGVSWAKFNVHEPGMLASLIITMAGFWWGWLAPAAFATLALVFGVYLAWLLFWRKA